MFIAVSFGISLLVTAWVFYRVTGGLFNPAITLALWLIGGLSAFRACLLVVAQLLGGIAAAALVAALTPFGGAQMTETTLGNGVNVGQGLFIEAFLTAILVLTVILLAAEKHKSTYLAPVGIGLTLMTCHMFAVAWTGCGINPARSFGPAVVSGSFPGYHWIYWVGPMIGTFMAVGFYILLKLFDYTSVVFGQDADHEVSETEKQLTLEQQASRDREKNQNLFKKARGKIIVFHRRKNSTGGSAPQVETFNPADASMEAAITAGDAVVVDLDNAKFQEDAMETGTVQNGGAQNGGAPNLHPRGASYQNSGARGASMEMTNQNQPTFINGVPSMRPEAQDVGGLLAPGTERAIVTFGMPSDVLQPPQR
jgi:aquaporin related protein